MQVTIVLTEKELFFLQKLTLELGNLRGMQISIEDSIHECIRMAMFEESEEGI